MSLPSVPSSITASPRLKQWIRIGPDQQITVYSGKVELGQGISTALAQIACEELGIAADQLVMVAGHTAYSPNEQYTAGSQSIEVGGAAIRCACAEARMLFMQAAARALDVMVDAMRAERGIFSCDETDRTTDYWSLADAVDLSIIISGQAPLRRRADFRVVGNSVARADLPAKLSGAAYIHDFVLPHMLHARMLRGPHPSCHIDSIDIDQLKALDGVTHVVRSGQFLAIAGPNEAELVSALTHAAKLVQWQRLKTLGEQTEIEPMLVAMPCESAVVHAQGSPAPAVTALKARYSRPYLAHAAIGPSCALADPAGGRLKVWSHTQGVFFLRDQIAWALGRDKQEVDVIHLPGAGCYGHNGADDVAFDAAFIAQSIGRAVRVQWMREDEMSASPFGSAGVTEIEAGLDANGRICDWKLQVWSHSHIKRPGWGDGVNLLGAWAIEPPLAPSKSKDVPLPNGGGQRNSIALYDLPHQQVTYHFIEHSPLRVSSMRGLGAYLNTFAIESFFDELAAQINVDPIDFRLRHLSDPRARAVIEHVARISGWQSNMAGASGTGMGIGFGQYKNHAAYCAVVARVRVEEKIHVEKVWAVVDAGAVINPDGLINQIEGGIIQSMSWTLKEAVTWSDCAITSNTWDTYPILNFDEVPQVEVVLLDQPEQPSVGGGEAAAGPTAAALGNALAHALGLRARHLPLTAARLAQLIDQS